MAEYLIQGDTLTGIADAIRSKAGTSGSINVSNMASAISNIETGSGTNVTYGTKTVTSRSNVFSFTCSFTPTKILIVGTGTSVGNDIFALAYDSSLNYEFNAVVFDNLSNCPTHFSARVDNDTYYVKKSGSTVIVRLGDYYFPASSVDYYYIATDA